jgi:hypothetical protein
MELTHGSETSAQYTLTPGKYPKELLQYDLTNFLWLCIYAGTPKCYPFLYLNKEDDSKFKGQRKYPVVGVDED